MLQISDQYESTELNNIDNSTDSHTIDTAYALSKYTHTSLSNTTTFDCECMYIPAVRSHWSLLSADRERTGTGHHGNIRWVNGDTYKVWDLPDQEH